MQIKPEAIDKFLKLDEDKQRRILDYMAGSVNYGIEKGNTSAEVIAKKFNELVVEKEVN